MKTFFFCQQWYLSIFSARFHDYVTRTLAWKARDSIDIILFSGNGDFALTFFKQGQPCITFTITCNACYFLVVIYYVFTVSYILYISAPSFVICETRSYKCRLNNAWNAEGRRQSGDPEAPTHSKPQSVAYRVFFNCSAQILMLKRKTLFNQRRSFVHREFDGTESLIGCPSFFILVLKIERNS